MTRPEDGARESIEAVRDGSVPRASPELEVELLAAERDFENGDYLELTAEELDRYIAGESRWPDGF